MYEAPGANGPPLPASTAEAERASPSVQAGSSRANPDALWASGTSGI